MSAEKITVGLVGCGNAGRNIHLRLLNAHPDLYRAVTCADTLPESAQKLAADFGLRAAESVEAMVADPEVELVVIATKPPVTHRDVAVLASAAGKHVVVEKPMAGTDAECAEMVAAAAPAGRVLAVHHNRRWDMDFLSVQTTIDSGVLGEIRLVRNEFAAGFSGSSYDWGIHVIDQTMALSPREKFVELTATLCQPNRAQPLESLGFFSARLRTESGIVHDMSMLPPVPGNAFLPHALTPRFVVAGTAGVLYQDWCERPEDGYMKTTAFMLAEGGQKGRDLGVVESRLTIPDFYDLLFTAIREGGPVPVPGEEGRRAVRAWELVCQSACEGRTLQVEL